MRKYYISTGLKALILSPLVNAAVTIIAAVSVIAACALSPGFSLKSFGETPTLLFYENHPMLDGATAAYPVYGAIAQALYKGLDESTVGRFVACSKTDEAYERLIRGEIDIFFGAQPSAQQLQAAKEKGFEFVLTPIAREAFVFFVHRENPVSSLSLEQIQDIYQKKITNWSRVDGNDAKIIPFQRPENSGRNMPQEWEA